MSGYSIVRLQTLASNELLERLYLNDPSLEKQTYEMQHRHIANLLITHTANFSTEMNELGNQSVEIFSDARILQQTWARENGVSCAENWQVEILVAQLRYWKPEVIFFQDIHSMPANIRLAIKELVPSIWLKAIQKGYPGMIGDLSDADILFVSSPILYERYSRQRPFLLYHSFNLDNFQIKQIEELDSENGSRELIDLSFFGQARVPELRYWAIQEFLKRTKLQAWLKEDPTAQKRLSQRIKDRAIWYNLKYEYFVNRVGNYRLGPNIRRFLPGKLRRINDYLERQDNTAYEKKKKLYGVQPRWTVSPQTLTEKFPNKTFAPIYGIEYYHKIRQSQVVFNCHSDEARNTVDNMRMFEVTGMGTCLLTDKGVNLPELFEEGTEIVTYSSLEEAIENAHYLLDNDRERKEIAEAGRRRTLKDHTLKKRCLVMHEIISEKLRQV